MTTHERLVLPLTPEGWPTGYTIEPLMLRHMDEWDDNGGWMVVEGEWTECPGVTLPFLPNCVAVKHGFREIMYDADGFVYADRDIMNERKRLYRITFDAGPVVCLEPPRTCVAADLRLISGMVCFFGINKRLHIIRECPDGSWVLSKFMDAHMRVLTHKYILPYTHGLHFLLVHARDDYVLK